MSLSWLRLSSFVLSLATLSILQPSLIAAQCDIPPLMLTWSNITVTQDGLGVARGIELGIGTPHQIFAFRPSTTLNNTRINNVINCGSAGNDSCIGSLGGAFDAPKSTSYAVSIKSQWNGSQIDDEGSTGAYVYFNDDVVFQENGNVDGFPLVMDSEVWGGEQSGLPLGTNSSFLSAAVAGGVAPSQVFGLWSGSRGIDPHDGLLVVGGYDRARVDPASNFTTFPIGEWSLERACPLQVTVTNLTYWGMPLIPPGSEELIACIEPSKQRFVFPPMIARMFGVATGQNQTDYPGDMQYSVASRPQDDLVVTLAGGYQSTIPNKELFAPLRGSDEHGRYTIIDDSTLQAFVSDTRQDEPGDVDNTLGGLFLTFNYLLVDYAKSEFQLAPAVAADAEYVSPDPITICTPTTSITLATPIPMRKKTPTNTGAIVGGVVGGVAGLALLGVVGFLLFRRNRQIKNPALSEMDGQSMQSVSRQVPEMMVYEVTPVHEMSASRHASLRKSEGRVWH